MPDTCVISIADEFSPVPAGRYYSDGKFTGQRFREELLAPKLKAGYNVELDIDGVESLPSSFWEEIFGGLVRDGYNARDLRGRINIKTTDDLLNRYKMLAWKFADEATPLHH